MELRPEDIQEILRIFSESELEELRLELGSTRLQVSKKDAQQAGERAVSAPMPSAVLPGAAQRAAPGGAPGSEAGPASVAAGSELAASVPQAPSVAHSPGDEVPQAAPPAREGLVEVRSPLLGVFYRRPGPNEPPFVEVGSTVGPDDPVCIVDVMKMFTQVVAGTAGRIAEISVEDGVLVEHGQVLMRIEPE